MTSSTTAGSILSDTRDTRTRVSRIEVIEVGSPGLPPAKGIGRAVITPMSGLRPDANQRSGLPPASVWTVIVRVWDTEGRSGIGSAGFGTAAARPIIEQHLAPLVVGHDPFDVEVLWAKMYRSTLNFGRKGVVVSAMSAIDIALWDLIGKTLDQPVYRLIGGQKSERIPVYASRLYASEDLDALADEARSYVTAGYAGVKQRLAYGPKDGERGMRLNLQLIDTVAEAIGPETDHMVDAYMGWDLGYAIRMIRRIEEAGHRLAWVEEPLPPDNFAGLAALRKAVATPIAGGEHEYTRHGFRDLLKHNALDIWQPDVNRAGGITEALKIWALAASFDIPVIPHAGQMHNYHLVISHMNSPCAEHFIRPAPGVIPDEDEIFYNVFRGEPDAVDGHIELNAQAAGLGLSLNDEFIDQFSVVRR